MTQQEIQDRNVEIARMLGWEQYKDSKERWFEHWKPNIMLEKPWSNRVERLEFDSNYNWLHEAIEFIERVGETSEKYGTLVDITTTYVRVGGITLDLKLNPITKKEAVFIAVSDFAKLQNNKEL
jgi:hypothetical protein